ncbi:hypothetical protein LTR66_000713 [Elasticomyces elasticus]|nr:hypothetical protein LTR66_000713 [Elasticomyces elasticus]
MADEEEHFFSDDDLDALPANALHQLEHNAISSTQKARATTSRPPSRLPPFKPPRVIPKQPQWQPAPTVQPPSPQPMSDPPSSDYGFDDEDVIDLDEPSPIVQPGNTTYGCPSNIVPQYQNAQIPVRSVTDQLKDKQQLLPEPDKLDDYYAAPTRHTDQDLVLRPGEPNPPDRSATEEFQARIEVLERERIVLQKHAEDANAAALARTGEIAIVRANHEKATKDYERRIAVIQQLHADEAAKQKAEIETARKEREKVQTTIRFLEHDLAQEVERANRLRALHDGSINANRKTGQSQINGALTPRRSKLQPYRDRFDDDEITMISPSKTKEKSKTPTPVAGAKRKRNVNDSPVPLLQLSQPQSEVRKDGLSKPQSVTASVTSVIAPASNDHRFQFTQRLLEHRVHPEHGRSLELLSKHTFPSDPATSLSCIVFDTLASPSTYEPDISLPLKVCNAFTTLWARCLKESFFNPLYLIISLINFVLVLEPSTTTSAIVPQLVPIILKTVDLIAVPTARASTDATIASEIDKNALEKLGQQIDVDSILDLLQYMAMIATLSAESLLAFWQRLEFTFVLLMLNKAQPLSHITLVLQILGTSNLTDTFGAINHNPEQQERNEKDTVDRLTSLLLETPRALADEVPYEDVEIAELRIEILAVLRTMCLTDHGGRLLAEHRMAIGRLIRFLDSQITKLYDIPPELSHLSVSDEQALPQTQSLHSLTVTCVNITARLIHHLLINPHLPSVSIPDKLAVIHGGQHKFLVSLTRLAFNEGLVYEAGIDEEVIDAAHEILDSMLSPEQGEDVLRAFETPQKSAHGSTTSAPM